MVSKDLTFNLFGRDVNATAAMRRVAAASEETSRSMRRTFGELPKLAAEATGGVIAGSVYMAAKFQSQMNLLQSAADLPAAKVKAIGTGIQALAASTGTPMKELADGAYIVAKSFGKDGAAGQLDVLRAAAQGAKAENVDLATSTNALTSVMQGYGLKSKDAVATENELVRASGLAKTTMQDFAGSLSNVTPIASALHVSFAEVGGAIATMTQHGESAQQSADNLNNLLTNLAGGSHQASVAMQQLGINTVDLREHLGERGISGTLAIVESKLKATGPGGMIAVDAFNRSATASQGLVTMLKSMDPAAAAMARGLQSGAVTSREFAKEIRGLHGTSAIQARQFRSLYNASQGFNGSLRSGDAQVQTSAQMLQHMLGGMTGMRAAMMLGGNSASTFARDVKSIGEAGQKSGRDISSWAITQKNTTVQMDILRESVAVLSVQLGSLLLPAVNRITGGLSGFVKGISSGNPAAVGLAATIGGLAVALTAVYLTQKAFAAGALLVQGAMGIARVAALAWTGVQWLLNAAMDANPIGIVIIAVGALIAVIVLLVTHWKEVCAFLQVVWGAVCKWFADTIAMFVHNWTMGWGLMIAAAKMTLNEIHDAVTGVIGTIRDFFAGAAGWLVDAGKNIIDGLINGIKGAVGAVTSVVSGVANGVIGTFKNLLGIHSPSTVFHDLGTNITQGLTNGLLGTQKQVQAATNRLADTVTGMFQKKKGGISAWAEQSALSTISSGTRELMAEAAKRASLTKQIATTQKTLNSELAAQKKAEATSLKQDTMTQGDITKWQGSGDMIQGLAGLVSNTKRFKTDLQKLVHMGIDQTTFAQIVAAGVNGGGLAAADQLISSPVDLREIASLQRQLQSAAGSLASFAGQQEYAPQISSTRAKLASLNTAQQSETRQSQRTAANMVNTVAREVHVHLHVSGATVTTKAELGKLFHDAVQHGSRAGHIPKDAFKNL